MNHVFKSIKVQIILLVILGSIALTFTMTGCVRAIPADSANATTDAGSTDNNKPQDTQSTEPSDPGFVFQSDQTDIPMHAPAAAVLAALGEELAYFEAESCAFEGLDKTYTYPGFDLLTYPVDGTDYVAAVVLVDDSVTTKEGLFIGADEAEIVRLYGEDYSETSPGAYIYEQERSRLQVIARDGEVISIEYLAIVEE